MQLPLIYLRLEYSHYYFVQHSYYSGADNCVFDSFAEGDIFAEVLSVLISCLLYYNCTAAQKPDGWVGTVRMGLVKPFLFECMELLDTWDWLVQHRGVGSGPLEACSKGMMALQLAWACHMVRLQGKAAEVDKDFDTDKSIER